MSGQPGWQQPPTCLHLGLLGAAFSLGVHPVGHVWVCSCGQRWVVAMGGGRKSLVRQSPLTTFVPFPPLPVLQIPVFESPHVPDGQVLTVPGQSEIVRSEWRQIRWPMFLREQKDLWRKDLDDIVTATERRLFGRAA
jgi:hypothetical protein